MSVKDGQGDWEVGRTARVDVLEADVEGGVGVRCEDGPRLADNVPRSAVFIPIGVANLQKAHVSPMQSSQISIRPCQGTSGTVACGRRTYVNVELHPVPLGPPDSRRHDHQRLLGHEVADAPLLLLVLAPRVRLDVELEGAGDAQQHEQAEERPRQGVL